MRSAEIRAECSVPSARFEMTGAGSGVRLPRGSFLLYDRCLASVRLAAGGDAASCHHSSVAQWQSIRLLTGGLLVRVQPEEPIPQ